ncbi:ankyrin repeat protein [Histomonas meleagridis]|nr:ankyrin repeat protein [Histomonas meleagridis]
MFENALREVIKLDDVQKFKALLYGKDGTYKLDDKYLTQICALLDSPGCMAQAILMGQPVNLDDSDEMCPLNCASFSGSVETAALLIEAGAHPNSVYKGETALMMAIRNSTIDHVKMLLDANADLARIEYAARYALHPDELIPFIDNGDKNVALEEAVMGGKSDNVKLLLKYGAKPSMMSLLVVHYAIMHNRPESLKYLIKKGAGVEGEINGTLPIHVAARHGRIECLKILIENGARINASDNLGCIPMHWAAILRSSEVMKYLLEKGSYVNLKDDYEYKPMVRKPTKDWSPIHASIEGNGVDVVRVLLDNNAEQIRMWDGRTPLHIAVQNDRKELFEMLRNHGAGLQAINAKDQTPIELAYALEREDLVEELRKWAGPDVHAAQAAKKLYEDSKSK